MIQKVWKYLNHLLKLISRLSVFFFNYWVSSWFWWGFLIHICTCNDYLAFWIGKDNLVARVRFMHIVLFFLFWIASWLRSYFQAGDSVFESSKCHPITGRRYNLIWLISHLYMQILLSGAADCTFVLNYSLILELKWSISTGSAWINKVMLLDYWKLKPWQVNRSSVIQVNSNWKLIPTWQAM